MMKHKEYPDAKSRRLDRQWGMALCLIVNVGLSIGRYFLLGITSVYVNSIDPTPIFILKRVEQFLITLPWIVNGGIIS